MGGGRDGGGEGREGGGGGHLLALNLSPDKKDALHHRGEEGGGGDKIACIRHLRYDFEKVRELERKRWTTVSHVAPNKEGGCQRK